MDGATILGVDYPTLWFLVIGALFTGYSILDGFDFGAGAWHLFFKKDLSRRIAMNAVGPVWDGNEVWLVIGGGALFAGFPLVYATLLSGLYMGFMLFLFFIILRAVAIEFRGKEKMKWWTQMWDVTYCVASIMLAFLLGVVLGNVLQGLPFAENKDINVPFLRIVNPFALLSGLTTLSLFMMHGGIYLLMKTEGKLFDKIGKLTQRAVFVFILFFSLMSLMVLLYFPHLSDRFMDSPWLFIVPIFGMLSIANIPRLLSKAKYFPAFIFSALAMGFFLIVVAIELYPSILISSIDPKYDITIYDAAASEKTLRIMLGFAAVGGPLVLSYTYFVYRTFKGKVKLDETSY